MVSIGWHHALFFFRRNRWNDHGRPVTLHGTYMIWNCKLHHFIDFAANGAQWPKGKQTSCPCMENMSLRPRHSEPRNKRCSVDSWWKKRLGFTRRRTPLPERPRLLARKLAKQFREVFEAECTPFQCALSTRAGTDCVGHMLRAATDANPTATILSVDGIGAYDHVHRAAMLAWLVRVPAARALLPFARMSCARPSSYTWYDDAG